MHLPFPLRQELPVLTAALQSHQQTARDVLPPWRLLQTPTKSQEHLVWTQGAVGK